VRSGWQARRGPAAELREVGLKTGRKNPIPSDYLSVFSRLFSYEADKNKNSTETIRKRDRKRFKVFPNRFLSIPFWIWKIPNHLKPFPRYPVLDRENPVFQKQDEIREKTSATPLPISRLPNFIPQSNKLDPQLKFIELLAEQPSRYVEEAWSLPG
jgi:hypothetical protein